MEYLNNKQDKQLSFFFGFGLALAFLLPHSSSGLMLINPLLCLFYQCFKQNRIWYKNSIIVLITLIISLLLNLNQELDQKSLMSFVAILLYVMCFPIVWKVKLPNYWIYIIGIFIFFSQIIYILHIPFFTNLLDSYYPVAENDMNLISYTRANVTLNTVSNFRLGGIYRNSNHCARALTTIFALFISNNFDKPIRKNLFFGLLMLIAILLTGSRTGFFVYGVMVMVYIYNFKKVHLWIRITLGLGLAVAFVYLLLNGSDTYRATNVVAGLSNSVNPKYVTFMDYLSHENSVMRYLFGYFSPERFSTSSSELLSMFDADYGYLIYQYGFIGFLGFLIFFYSIFKKMNKVGKAFFVLLLWMVSSTIVTSYRAFFIFMMALSYVYSEHKLIKTQN